MAEETFGSPETLPFSVTQNNFPGIPNSRNRSRQAQTAIRAAHIDVPPIFHLTKIKYLYLTEGSDIS